MGESVDRILLRWKALEGARRNSEVLWDDVGKFVLPMRRDSATLASGSKRQEYIFDSTPTRAAHRLASALNSMLTPRSSRWLRGRQRVGLDDDTDILEWTDTVSRLIHEDFSRSNFHIRVNEFYMDYGTVGTAVLYFADGFWFDVIPIWECYIDENERGVVDTLFRKFKLTARQAAQKFDEAALPNDIKEALKVAPDKEWEFLHAVFPRGDFNAKSAGPEKFPYASVWVELKSRKVLDESGFFEFPYMVARWTKYSGEVYGRSPAIEAMADIKNLHSMAKANLKGARLITEPALDMEDNTYLSPIKTGAGQINRRTQGSNALTPLYTITQLPVALEIQNQIRKAVNESFYYQQLSLIDNDRMTATEVMQRTEENMRILGPNYDRLERDLLVPLVQRAFGLRFRSGGIPEMPEGMEGEPFTYESPLARAQRLNELASVQQGLGVVAPLVQLKPDIMDTIDLDEIAREAWKLSGVMPKAIRDGKTTDAIRQQRAQQQAEMQAVAMAQALAKAGKDASQADPNAGMLGEISRAVGG